MIKLTFMVKRRPGMTHDEFVDYHRNRHAPLFASIPESERYVRGYVISHPVPTDAYPEPEHDGMTEIWFDTWEDHDAFFSSQNYREIVHPDEPNLIIMDDGVILIAEETRVI
jgi:uncharacterized protein (TIGR02118 family)